MKATNANPKTPRKKSQTSSVAAAVEAALAVMEPMPQPPKHVRLRERDMPFWDAIMRARAREEWTDNQLVIAAQLARCQSDIEEQQELLDAEGMVIDKEGRNGSTVPFANPRATVLERLAARQIYLMRSMGMLGYVANGDKRDVQGARKLQEQARKVQGELADEELLAT